MRRIGWLEEREKLELFRQLGAVPVQAILIGDKGDVVRRKLHRSLLRLVFICNLHADVVAVLGHVIGPDLLVAGKLLRPFEPRDSRLQPIYKTIVQVCCFPRCVEIEAPCCRLGVPVGVGAIHRLHRISKQFIARLPRRRDQSFPQIDLDVRGRGLFHDIHDLITQMLPRLPVRACIAKDLHEHAPLLVVGVDDSLTLIIPQGSKLCERRIG